MSGEDSFEEERGRRGDIQNIIVFLQQQAYLPTYGSQIMSTTDTVHWQAANKILQ